MPINGFGIGFENLRTVLFEVIELATFECPSEHAKDAEHQHGGHGNEEVEDVHSVSEAESFSSVPEQHVKRRLI
jgi:hypothetical protein